MPTLPATTVDFFLAGLESFMRRSGQDTHWGVTVLRLGGKPDAEALTSRWEQIHAHHPMLGARLKRAWRGWRLVWDSPGPIPAPPVVWHPSQPLPPGAEVLRERFQGRDGGGPLHSPLLMEVFPFGQDGEHVVLLTWRHALLDGTGINLLLEKLASGDADASPPEMAVPKREGIGRVFQRARPLMKRLHAMTSAGCLSAWAKDMPKGGEPDFRVIELSHGQSELAMTRLRTTCGEFLQMPFYAAVAARALRLLHEKRGWRSPEIHLHLPCQSRGRSRNLVFGNHMGTLPLFLDAGALGTLEEAVQHLLATYREAMRQDMPRASEALMTLASHLPVRWFIPAVRLTNRGQICSLFHSHTGSFLPGRSEFTGAPVQNVCTIPNVCSPPGLGVFFSDFAGRITVTLSWRRGVISPEEADLLSRGIEADLTDGSPK